MSPVKIFLTGSTGYIGGSVLTRLLQSPERYEISALVRKKEQGETLKKLGVTPVLGSLDDAEILFEASKAADAVINAADSDHLPSAQAIVRGLKAKNNNKAVLLHTSGTGVLTYDPITTIPFDDEDITRIHAIPLRSLHKEIDSWIFENAEDITAAIIAPSTVNGIGDGPFKKVSQQVIGLAKASVRRKRVGYVGDRKDVTWGNVNIRDVTDLYILLLEGLLAGNIDHGKEGGWYFATQSEHTWYKIGESLASVLHKFGLVESTELLKFEKRYVDEYLGGDGFSIGFVADSKAVANRSKRIGWKPSGPNVYETLEEEVKYLIDTKDIGTLVHA
ncbi:hypothetical protein K7432_009427 [Basidiobolus ranarum]|uniref:NAD(P)-binding domain-containing protein n=1 Tax=Basidiobolus ranarum TaxID=34480 RepID=A0ABR2VXH2_9FUNG